MRTLLSALWLRFRRRPAPRLLVNLYLAIRWRCRIHPGADIQYPSRCVIAAGARVGRSTVICRAAAGKSVRLGRVIIHDGVIIDALNGFVEIGDRTELNPYCVLYGTGGLRIGKECGIATHTVIVAANHRFDRLDTPIMRQPIRAQGITIGDDVWIAAGCTILDGVELASGTVVAAGAVVADSFPPGSVVAGVPARLLRLRSEQPFNESPTAHRG